MPREYRHIEMMGLIGAGNNPMVKQPQGCFYDMLRLLLRSKRQASKRTRGRD